MKSLNKRKQDLSTAGEIINSCICRTHSCSCSIPNYYVRIDTHESLYHKASKWSVGGVEPTSVSKI